MQTFKYICAAVALVLGLLPYIPYLRDIFRNKTQPHLYSWLLWGILQSTGVIAMIIGGAGFGAVGLAAGTFFELVILGLSFKYGTKNITRLDKICLVGALFAIVIWIIQKNPLVSVILISAIDFVAFIPTYRKGYAEPESETVSSYFLWSLANIFGILALSTYSIITTFYIASLTITNLGCALILLAGKKKLKQLIA